MKKGRLFLLLALVLSIAAPAQPTQTEKVKLYNPAADAKADIQATITQADKEGKNVLLQIGGNWCSWCYKFNDTVTGNDTLKTALENNFVSYHLNYSPENRNEDVLASLGYPQRFGFPVFVILDGKGNRLHTQNSEYLEKGNDHSPKKVLEFFNHWSPAALDPRSYEKK